MPQKLHPLILSDQAMLPNATITHVYLCKNGTLDPMKAKGKVVVCFHGYGPRLEKGLEVKRVGGVAMVLCNDVTFGDDVRAEKHFLPTTHLSYEDGLAVINYIKETKFAMAYLTPPFTHIGTKPAPFMADFSSRGPNAMSCPHVAGVVGLLKFLHPDWSPAAIQSAIMTSAEPATHTDS